MKESYVDKIGVFTCSEDEAWSQYSGKKGVVLEEEFYEDGGGELKVKFFMDGLELTIQMDEFELNEI